MKWLTRDGRYIVEQIVKTTAGPRSEFSSVWLRVTETTHGYHVGSFRTAAEMKAATGIDLADLVVAP